WLSEYISTLFFYSLQKENRIIGEKYVSCGINCFNIDSNIKKKNNISISKLIRRILEKI
ncbi:glycosyl transferase, partial [Campylobacter jejuni]|nr:glycosyl transferase [Campylobacter jejuni]